MRLADDNVNNTWLKGLYHIAKGWDVVPRGLATREVLAATTKIPMKSPVLTIPDRKLGYRFMAAEAAWILSGDNRVSTIAPYSKVITQFSDDGERFFGAYGPKVIDQISYVVDKLVEDRYTRHGLINIWREKPRDTKDVPCTISLQFMVRERTLYCFDTMRSSDWWLGWPYDIFNMSMIALAVKIMYKQRTGENLKLGYLYLTAASQHIYETHFDAAEEIFQKYSGENAHAVPPASKPIFEDRFKNVDELVSYLWGIADMATNDDAKRELFNGFHVR